MELLRQQKKTGKIIEIINGQNTNRGDLRTVASGDHILTDPEEIHMAATSHFQTHHSLNKMQYPDDLIDWTDPESVLASESRFKDHLRNTLPGSLHHTITHLWQGFAYPWLSAPASDVKQFKADSSL
jgi:hypothetical protein